MKKVVLSLMFASCILATSCKGKEENKDEMSKDVETEVETEKEIMVENPDADGFVDIEIPEFSDERVVENLKDYSLYVRNYIAAKGDGIKLYDLAEERKRILKEGRELVGKLPKEEQDKYSKTIALIQAKIQE